MQPSKSILSTLFLLLLTASVCSAGEQYAPPDRLVARAIAGDATASTELRRFGAAAVDAMLAAEPTEPSSQARWQRALDRVCAQRDCVRSRLFWHTDLDTAVAEARRSNRPILSLRLLGQLDEELSCANSRFFRLLLYPDPRVADLLRQRFVLHWSSERPVPTVRIDFGDGRSLAGTITGNSIHYVLDRQGRVVDALPGLHGPGRFLSRLTQAAELAHQLADLDVVSFRDQRAISHAIDRRLMLIQPSVQAASLPFGGQVEPVDPQTPSAREAGVRAVSKAAVEMPIIDALSIPGSSTGRSDWPPHAGRDNADWALSEVSESLLRDSLSAVDPTRVEATLDRFLDALAEDSWRNTRYLRPVIQGWLSERDAPIDLEALNARVYSELFLTPASDPWLGLATVETFLALSGVAPEPRGAKVASLSQLE